MLALEVLGFIVAAMRILIVEDEPKTAAFLRQGFAERGFAVDVAANGADGLRLATDGGYDLAVLDVMLPRLDGWSLLKKLRAGGSALPVIFLTARDDVADRVNGLELGADDYLVKPFAFAELLARVRTLLRRGPSRPPECIRIADLEIDPSQHRATRAGRHLHLTPKELQILLLLARCPGEAVSRTTIVEQVWDIHFETGTNMVEAALRRLRAKVDDPFEPKLIQTVRGIGYVLTDPR